MGCGGSKDQTTPEKGSINRVPKVIIRVDQDLTDSLLQRPEKPKAIFIFGGPGSKKGRIVDDLIHTYGFHYICVEQLIFRELPRKVQNVIKLGSIKETCEYLRDVPDSVTLEWVLETITQEIERHLSVKTFIIDFVPNLKYLLKISHFMKDDVSKEFAAFEVKNQIGFALNLAISDDKVIENNDISCAKHPDANKKLKEMGGGQSDEADSSRTQKRATMHAESVSTLLKFFESTNRLVTVDVSSGIPDLIWLKVSEFFSELKFVPKKTVNTVILFSFNGNDFDGLDLERYKMQKIHLKTLTDGAEDSVSKLLSELCTVIDSSPHNIESFAVDASDTVLATEADVKNNLKKQILFLDEGNSFLDQYIVVTTRKPTRRVSLFAKEYNAICTCENEVCLFPTSADAQLCRYVALTMANMRKL